MSNKAVTSRTRQLAIRLPLDVADEVAARQRGSPWTTRGAIIVAALRQVWRLPEPTCVPPNPQEPTE